MGTITVFKQQNLEDPSFHILVKYDFFIQASQPIETHIAPC
jgi:hypothetical protein